MKRTPLIAASILVATALPAAQAHAARLPTKAYFKVFVTAAQDITWKQDFTDHSCGGVFRLQGSGTSLTNFGTSDWEPMVAKRTGGRVTFSFAHGRPDMPATGSVERQGSQTATTYVRSESGACGQHIDIPPDCGVHRYPSGTRLRLAWDSPRTWSPGMGPGPRDPSLYLRQYVPNETVSMGYLNCPGERDDYMLGVNAYPAPGTLTGFGPLPLTRLFGRSSHIVVRGGLKAITKHAIPPTATGGWDADTSLHWTVRLVRLSRAPAGL